MSLYKRDRKYSISIWVDGVRHLKSTGTTNRREAETIEREFREELNRRRHQIREASPDMTFVDLAARFLADGSPRPYHLDRLKVLLPYFGDFSIGRISKPLVREYRTERAKEKRLSETTLNRDVEVLRHLLYWAVDEGFLTTNPVARIRLVRVPRKPRPVMSVAEEAMLLGAAAPHLRAIIIAALDTGMRRGELLTERWEHIDFPRRVLFVTHSKTADGEAREIPLTSRLAEFLSDCKKREGLVFTFKDRSIHRIKTAWKAAIRRAGIRYCRFHDLRHTFNTRLMEAGVVQDVRKALMGHSSGEEINSLYTHVELPVKRDAIRKLEAWVEAQKQNQETETQGEPHDRPEPSHRGEAARGDSHRLSAASANRSDETQRSGRVPRR
ncbi:MAG: tyrosine-type recombinase/integrase [Candidatus Sulfotelmatobacter sp.]